MKWLKPLLYLLLLTLTACASRTSPPGSPLPPQNKAVGDKWPPEVREFVDVFTTRFADGQPMPTEEQIQQWLHVRTAEIPEGLRSSGGVETRYIRDWPLDSANNRGSSSYWKSTIDPDRRQYMRISMSIDTSRYCINPYDLAIYTGFRFEPKLKIPSSIHDPGTPRPRDPWGNVYGPDYVWGMFSRAPDRFYDGNYFLSIRLTEDLRCVSWIEAHSFFRAKVLPTKD